MFGRMDWQEMMALGLVAVTAVLFAWHLFGAKRFQLQRGAPCGCGSQPRMGTAPVRIICRARKGEPSRWIVQAEDPSASSRALAAKDHIPAAMRRKLAQAGELP